MYRKVLTCLALLACHNRVHATATEAAAHKTIHTPQTITVSRPHKVCANITGAIIVSVSDVTIDLNGYAISGGAHGIVINTGLSNITIKNGTISAPTSGNGIEIQANCQNIDMYDLHIDQCAIGINIASSNNITMTNCRLTQNTNEGIKLTSCSDCEIKACSARSNNTGFLLDQTDKSYVVNCMAASNTQKGFVLSASSRVIVDRCKALHTGTTSTGDSFGFLTENGSKNSFINCLVEGVSTTATLETNIVAGFALQGTETTSSIIGCISGNIETPSNGQAIPYGIVATTVLQTPVLKTSWTWTAEATNTIWSPTGTLLATAGPGTSGRELSIYSFNRNNDIAAELANLSRDTNIETYSLSWNKIHDFIAISALEDGITDAVVVCHVDQNTGELTIADSHTPSLGSAKKIDSVSWSPAGSLLVAGGEEMDSKSLFLYHFDVNAQTISSRQTIAVGARVYAVAWSPAHNFVAAAGVIATGNELRIYEYDAKNQLVLKDSAAHGATLHATAWSPDGHYLAVGGVSGTGAFEIRIYELDTTAKTITLRDSVSHGATVSSVCWSPDSNYLLIGGDVATSTDVRIYSFSHTTKTGSLAHSISHGASINSVSWSPDGLYMLIAGVETGTVSHRIYEVLTAPSRSIIRNNSIHDVKGGVEERGVGVSVPSISNLVVRNITHDNDHAYQFNTRMSHTANPDRLLNYQG